jgi:hypothetical protein
MSFFRVCPDLRGTLMPSVKGRAGGKEHGDVFFFSMPLK